ncbi:hypothetical protein ASD24_20440 [Paenibacillus sp. Root52]|uniref:DUF1795 domain-containing protein n=1 Tax=Paenibacillus amylolyticus TaxID=1451 RepID=A0AAP5H408_PAEAM|nr:MULTISPECIES: PsbP-related protein [Paenibacillus]KQY93542.1 hypothetical protein ASD24_20440 [Paenibacillus sp. Root52]MDR6725933.1 hypothetical protein [Paenibacillus amylolyticus]
MAKHVIKGIVCTTILSLSAIVTVTGCSTPSAPSYVSESTIDSESIVSSKDAVEKLVTFYPQQKELSVSLPSEWEVVTEEISPSLLKLATKDQTRSLRIDRVNREDYIPDMSLTDYMVRHQENINAARESVDTNDEVIRTSQLMIDQKEAYVKEGRTNYGKHQFGYITAFLETNQHFYIITYTKMYQFTAADQEFFEQMAQHFRILNDKPTDYSTSSEELIPHQGKYAQFQISTPSNWQVHAFELSDSALDISLAENNEQLSVYLASKDEFDSDLTLEDYGRYVAEVYADGKDTPIPDLKPVEINGLKGIQLEGHYVDNERQTAELRTILESQNHFVEIVFYTTESRFDRVKKDYEMYTSTYEEPEK